MSSNELTKEELLEAIEKLNEQIEELGNKISELIVTDRITNLHNRKALYKILEYEINRAERNQSYLSVLLIGVANYESIKNKFGEETLNVILIQIARLIKKSVRTIDILGRYDEDVFMLILPDINPNKGGVVADRIQRLIDKEIFPGIINLTICKGLKSYNGEPAHKVIELAERALYLEKKQYER